MAEPTTTAVIGLTAGSLAIFGLVTGLQPALLLAGMAGGWWALSIRDPLPLPRRITSIAIAAIFAAWGAPVAASLIGSLSWWPGKSVAIEALQLLVALVLGRLAHTVLGSSLDKLAKRKMEGV